VPATDALLRDPGVRVSTLPLLLQPALASNGNVTLVHHSETCPLTSHLSRRIAPYYAHTRIAQERVSSMRRSASYLAKHAPTTLFSAEIFPLSATMHTRWTSVRHRILCHPNMD
jgi:hypothetical protein